MKEMLMDLREDFLFGVPPNPRRRRLIGKLIGVSAGKARHILRYLYKAMKVKGDVCEFGTAQGATSALLGNEIMGSGRRLWLFDSFLGLSRPSEKDVLINDILSLGSMDKYEGRMKCSPGQPLKRLAKIGFPSNQLKIVEGFIEKTIHGPDLPAKVAFAFVDFDFYEPIRTALTFLDNSLSVGGYVLVDDYGWFSSGAQTAVDEFVKATGSRFKMVLPLSSTWSKKKFCVLKKISDVNSVPAKGRHALSAS